jgi:hypothetical protein
MSVIVQMTESRRPAVRLGFWAIAMAGIAFGAAPSSAAVSGGQVLCAVGQPCIDNVISTASAVGVQWHADQNYDAFNVRWSRPGRAETQSEVAGGRQGTYTVNNAHPGVQYTFKVQGCIKHFAARSSCTPWEAQTVIGGLAFGADTCRQGFVWREVNRQDHVCVTPQTRQQVANDNRLAAQRRQPGGGPFGFDTCRQGFVWREAVQGDHVCVTPQQRQQAAEDNRLAPQRRLQPGSGSNL